VGSVRLTTQSRRFVVLLSGITALAPLGIDTSLPALPIMARALHTSDAVIQATLGSFMLAFALGQLVIGPLSDRYGRRPVIAAGMALFAVAGILCAVAVDGRLLVAARFVQGFGACAGAVVGRAMIRDIFTDRARAAQMQAYASAISGVVPMLAPLLGAALLSWGWRAIYAALVAGGVLLLAATVAWLAESLAERAPSARVVHVFERYRTFLALPRSPALCALVAFSFAGLFAFISGSPFVLVRELGLSNAHYALAFALSSGSILAGSWTTGVLARRVGSERMLAAAAVGAALAGGAVAARNVLVAQPPAAWQFVALMALYAFTFGVIVPNAFAAAMERAGTMAGVGAGMLGATQMLGGAVGSTINGALPLQGARRRRTQRGNRRARRRRGVRLVAARRTFCCANGRRCRAQVSLSSLGNAAPCVDANGLLYEVRAVKHISVLLRSLTGRFTFAL
jgi:DHA1 family bicyclomycin/chloramphenicol resistance-like MFS transporter